MDLQVVQPLMAGKALGNRVFTVRFKLGNPPFRIDVGDNRTKRFANPAEGLLSDGPVTIRGILLTLSASIEFERCQFYSPQTVQSDPPG